MADAPLGQTTDASQRGGLEGLADSGFGVPKSAQRPNVREHEPAIRADPILPRLAAEHSAHAGGVVTAKLADAAPPNPVAARASYEQRDYLCCLVLSRPLIELRCLTCRVRVRRNRASLALSACTTQRRTEQCSDRLSARSAARGRCASAETCTTVARMQPRAPCAERTLVRVHASSCAPAAHLLRIGRALVRDEGLRCTTRSRRAACALAAQPVVRRAQAPAVRVSEQHGHAVALRSACPPGLPRDALRHARVPGASW